MGSIRTWLGGNSGNEYNVTTAANFNPSGALADTDSLQVVQGAFDLSVNPDIHTIDLVDLSISSGFTGAKIGTSAAAPLKVSVTGVASIRQGQNTVVYLESGDNPIVMCEVISDWPTAQTYLTGTFGTLIIRRGTVILNCTFTKLIIAPLNGDPSNVNVTNIGGTQALVECLGAGFATGSPGPTITTLAAALSFTKMLHGTVTNIELWTGALLQHFTPTNITSLNVRPGAEFDASGDPRAKTITTMLVDENGKFTLKNGPNNITVTNGIKRPNGKLVVEG